jgi:hypothetical protein
VLWHGAMAAASATMVGHFPWFFTFNFLQVSLMFKRRFLSQFNVFVVNSFFKARSVVNLTFLSSI